MKILLVCRCDGWMGDYMSQVSSGFVRLGHEVERLDYHRWDKGFLRRISGKGPRAVEHRTAKLAKHLADSRPRLVIFALAHLLFDFGFLRNTFEGPMVFFDMDGPALPCYQDDLRWVRDMDLVATVSRRALRHLNARGHDNILYWPHGVDHEKYRPLALSAQDLSRFSSPLAFVGRPTERRAALLGTLPAQSLALWGSRWSRKPYRDDPALAGAVREKEDILGENLVKMYNASTVLLNILREPFAEAPTILNLQVFAVPACGTCLLTEWVEEVEEAFEPGAEILTFRTPEQFTEQALRYSRDPAAARKIGAAGRKRCLAHHTHTHRARELLKALGM
ncbi:MAG: glycosyltransferase [Deltaproteobacteria bacterium]|nr:glycosyltransferase [Deltaproteobacteria bacterium]MBW1923435.1 glycosyltransferase [Deltaproteobacteria bacterium]MBW1948847.1 glycosyltransferase [Deltaproteobacteria bacterium]MBW2008941.1 glycosyltransferase [Deltaproteobacteria bacterium]MBW2347345.1 glycosyltransferase [Deltaproteobacteria bacterium]